jgi:hypothetical protein
MALSDKSSALPRRVTIERVDGRDPFRLEGVQRGTTPAVVTGAIAAWPALTRWTPDYLASVLGDRRVRATLDLPEEGAPYAGYTDEHAREMTVVQFVAWLRAPERTRACYVDQLPLQRTSEIDEDVDWSCLVPREAGTPQHNLWLGSAGTRSGLHYDSQDNFLVQISGRKRASLVSPADSMRTYPFRWNIHKSQIDPEHPDLGAFPRFADATVWEAELGPGDALFIPGTWWHHLHSLETSISINGWYGLPKQTPRQFFRRMTELGAPYWAEYVRQFAVHGVLGFRYRPHLFSGRLAGEAAYTALKRNVKAEVRKRLGRSART